MAYATSVDPNQSACAQSDQGLHWTIGCMGFKGSISEQRRFVSDCAGAQAE